MKLQFKHQIFLLVNPLHHRYITAYYKTTTYVSILVYIYDYKENANINSLLVSDSSAVSASNRCNISRMSSLNWFQYRLMTVNTSSLWVWRFSSCSILLRRSSSSLFLCSRRCVEEDTVAWSLLFKSFLLLLQIQYGIPLTIPICHNNKHFQKNR